jgi:D-aminopeptidase
MKKTMPRIGRHPSGPRDLISDVKGVTVGHCTIAEGDVQTGVTVIREHPGDVYRKKAPACAHVINGHTKSSGYIQLQELGVLETPIALTNTLCVGAVMMSQVREAIRTNPGLCRTLSSVNPVVCECSDAHLSDIQRLSIGDREYLAALADCREDFRLGAVGAGRGMMNFGLKGGIGSASRVVEAAGRRYTVGVLALTNFGKPHQLLIEGERVGEELCAAPDPHPESGSCIMVVATDAPLEYRQLRRLAVRATAGLARTGSVFGHGSGDEVIAFTTAYTIDYRKEGGMRPPVSFLYDEDLDPVFFEAAADATEQSVLKALWAGETVTGFGGTTVYSLLDAWKRKIGRFDDDPQ